MRWRIWTDGSCKHGLPNVPKGLRGWGGWAAIVEHGSDGCVVRGRVAETTNVRMEILAAIEGLRVVPDGERALLHTDCTTLLTIRDWRESGRLDMYTGRDSRLCRELAAELDRVQVEMVLLVRGHRDLIHRRAHALAGAEATGGLRNLPKNAVPLPWTPREGQHRLRKHLRERTVAVHMPGCLPGLCVSSCEYSVYESRRRSEARRAV